MERIEVVVHRELGRRDQADVTELLTAAAAVDGQPALSEQKRMEVTAEPGGTTAGARSLARDAGSGALLGYGHLSRGNESWGIEIVVHPDRRAADGQFGGSLLLGALLEEVGRQGGGQVYFWAPRATEVDDRIAEANGLVAGRELIQMRVPLPLAPRTHGHTDALVTRPFRPGYDEAAWLAVNNRAFATHPEQGGWEMEDIVGREREAWFDPAGLLLYEVDGQLGGSCWTKIHRDLDPPLGEIYVISVDPDFQGRGLGRSLTEAGLSWLAHAGMVTGMLYVDGDNVAAVQLYRSMGFVDDHVDRAYTGTIAAQG